MPGVMAIRHGDKLFTAKVYTQDDNVKYIHKEGRIWIVKQIGKEQLFNACGIYNEIYEVVGPARIIIDEENNNV